MLFRHFSNIFSNPPDFRFLAPFLDLSRVGIAFWMAQNEPNLRDLGFLRFKDFPKILSLKS